MNTTSGENAEVGQQPDVSQWWRTVTPTVIADATKVAAAFIEQLPEPLESAGSIESFDVARAIAIQVLANDLQPLKALLDHGQRAESALLKSVQARNDPRGENSFKSAHHVAQLVAPVLRLCSDMVPSTDTNRAPTHELAEALREVLFEVQLLSSKFGIGRPIRGISIRFVDGSEES